MNASLPRTGALAIVAGLTIAAAGCGSSDDKGLSKAEFIKQSDAICKKGDTAIDAAAKKAFGASQPSKAQVKAFVTKTVVPRTRTQLADIRKLDAPKDDADQVKSILDAADAGLDKVEASPELAVNEGQAADPFSRANKLAKAYGLKTCSSS